MKKIMMTIAATSFVMGTAFAQTTAPTAPAAAPPVVAKTTVKEEVKVIKEAVKPAAVAATATSATSATSSASASAASASMHREAGSGMATGKRQHKPMVMKAPESASASASMK